MTQWEVNPDYLKGWEPLGYIVDEAPEWARNYEKKLDGIVLGHNYWTAQDEAHLWKDSVLSTLLDTYTAPAEVTELRVTLSRDLTWAEREGFREDCIDGFSSHRFLSPDVFVYTDVTGIDSRELAWGLHDYFATEMFNVYIKAVRTISPKVEV